jgi:hypothetical protein
MFLRFCECVGEHSGVWSHSLFAVLFAVLFEVLRLISRALWLGVEGPPLDYYDAMNAWWVFMYRFVTGSARYGDRTVQCSTAVSRKFIRAKS